MREEFIDSIFYPYSRYESKMVELLEAIMIDAKCQWISYFIYELDFGKNYVDGCVSYKKDNGGSIDISTPEKLYDFLIKNIEESNNNGDEDEQ